VSTFSVAPAAPPYDKIKTYKLK